MSKLIFIDKEEIRFNFYCRTENTRHGFKHIVQLFENGIITSTGTCYYINRTWEKWNYQSACLTAMHNKIDKIIDNELKCFKAYHNYDRMTTKRKEEFNQLISENSYIQVLKAVCDDLNKNCY